MQPLLKTAAASRLPRAAGTRTVQYYLSLQVDYETILYSQQQLIQGFFDVISNTPTAAKSRLNKKKNPTIETFTSVFYSELRDDIYLKALKISSFLGPWCNRITE